MKGLLNMYISEGVVHFWRKGLNAFEMHRQIEYMVVPEVVSAHHGFTNVVTNSPSFSVR